VTEFCGFFFKVENLKAGAAKMKTKAEATGQTEKSDRDKEKQ
jgi:hypothetical protein